MSTTINWPASLPSFLVKDWNYKKKSSIIKSEMETGQPKRRRRTTSELAYPSGTLEVSSTQLSTFIDFVENTLAGGVLSFNWPEFITGSSKEVVLNIGTGEDLYSVKQVGENSYSLKLSLEVLT